MNDNPNDIKVTSTLATVEEWFNAHKNGNGIISDESAARTWGFSNLVTDNVTMTFPSTNLTNDIRNGEWKFNLKFAKNDWHYTMGAITVYWNDCEYRIYDKERTFIDLYRKHRKKLTPWFFEIAHKFFTESKYNSRKLHEYAEKFNVLHSIQLLEGAYKG